MPVIYISNGRIEEISRDGDTVFVTVVYTEGSGNRRREQTIRLAVNARTVILNANGMPISRNRLREGMIIDAAVSSAMTRSIPPQAEAFVIRVERQPPEEEITIGTILEIDRRNRSFTVRSDRERSAITQFNISEATRIFNRFGRPIRFSELASGMRVRVRHANFMTASIPPQTTAFEVRVLRDRQ